MPHADKNIFGECKNQNKMVSCLPRNAVSTNMIKVHYFIQLKINIS